MNRHPVVAALYDRMAQPAEKAGMRDMRAELLSEARGRTLEIGAGTGLNLAQYGSEVTELVLLEPDPFMAKRLRRRIAAEAPSGASVDVVEATAEQLPFEHESFDTVVATLVLCSVEDPGRVLGEVARVLKPSGRFLYLEHVRSESPRLARWQDRLERPWGWFAGGCHPNRDTAAVLARGGFDLNGVESGTLPRSALLIRPVISG
ncbi:MAG: class I SAM-dependent methyltransferase, partial [Actinomycetota bacterium]